MANSSPHRCRLCGDEFQNRNLASDHLADEHDLYAIITDATLEECNGSG